MGARIINFPLNKVLPAKNLSGAKTLRPAAAAAAETDFPDYRPAHEIKSFGDILRDEDLARDMFSPDYFLLVE